MFDEENYTSNPVSVSEERELLEQIVSLGVRYRYGNRLATSSAAISHADMFHSLISRTLNAQKCSDADSIIQDTQNHIRNKDDGYYLLDLHKGCVLVNGQHPIEDIIIDFTFWNTDDRVLLRGRKGACLHDTRFLVVPDAVYFLGMNKTYFLLKEFHALSFIHLDGNSKTGFVVDYDAAQNERPLLLFPSEENSGIIQAQLDHDDHCRTVECEYYISNIGSDRKTYRRMPVCSSKSILKKQ